MTDGNQIDLRWRVMLLDYGRRNNTEASTPKKKDIRTEHAKTEDAM